MVVYAKVDGTIIWSSVRANHKQGRVMANVPMSVIGDSGGWYEISEDVEGYLDREVADGYPNFYVAMADVVDQPPVEEPPVDPPPVEPIDLDDDVTDTEAAIAIMRLLKWLKQ